MSEIIKDNITTSIILFKPSKTAIDAIVHTKMAVVKLCILLSLNINPAPTKDIPVTI